MRLWSNGGFLNTALLDDVFLSNVTIIEYVCGRQLKWNVKPQLPSQGFVTIIRYGGQKCSLEASTVGHSGAYRHHRIICSAYSKAQPTLKSQSLGDP